MKKEDSIVTATGLILLIGFTLPGNVIARVRPTRGVLALIFSDWLFHFGGLALFTMVLAWDLESRKKESGRNPSLYLLAGMFSFAYALFIEILQIFIPYRNFEFKDLFWDTLGIALVLAGIYFIKRYKRQPGKCKLPVSGD